MMTNRERYLGNSTNMRHLVRLTLAVRAQLPKKYWGKLHAVFKHHPEVIETHQLTLTMTELRLLWRCPVVELPRLLDLMTRGSHGTMTYEIQAGQPGIGDTIQLTFHVPVDIQGGKRDGRES
jgi:hypothetical protein